MAYFQDDGIVPNNPRLPFLLYRSVVSPTSRFDPGTILDTLFESNGWGQVHEVLGVARGTAKIECGGIKGRILELKMGDVAVLPAGTGHRLIEASRNFLVVGAYPKHGIYDECTDTRGRDQTYRKDAAANQGSDLWGGRSFKSPMDRPQEEAACLGLPIFEELKICGLRNSPRSFDVA